VQIQINGVNVGSPILMVGGLYVDVRFLFGHGTITAVFTPNDTTHYQGSSDSDNF
jgi:hypothetical protein